MARTKLKRFSKLNDLKNVFNINKTDVKESLKNFFNENNRFTLEIGCGHGDYSIELAQKFHNRNFIGIDVKGARVYNGAMKALEMNIENVAFILTKAQRLNEIFEQKSIEEIYLPFPDPHVRRKNQERRLVSRSFLTLYQKLLIDSGLLHLKTDDSGLFDYAIKSITNSAGKILHISEDLYNDETSELNFGIITSFEKHFINEGRKIKYICFRF